MAKQDRAVIAAARRTPVVPRGGALAALQADELAAPVMSQLMRDAGVRPDEIDHVILGNALYGGGNPARMAALRSGIPQNVPAMTIDTQCCSGHDAILMGARLIESGAATCVLAGGAESFSRSPLRLHRPMEPDVEPVAYTRPAFAPPPFDDPDLTEAAASLAAERNISRKAQAEFAVASHEKALASAAALKRRLVQPGGELPTGDAFTRKLGLKAAMRAPLLAGSGETGLNAATIACEADGAAAVLLVAERRHSRKDRPVLRILEGLAAGGDPANPALAPISVGQELLQSLKLDVSEFASIELMEAFAVQAMVTTDALGIEETRLNPLGGALARGHPIGASGAILLVQLFETLRGEGLACCGAQKYGMALIAAAGGLAAGLVVEREHSECS